MQRNCEITLHIIEMWWWILSLVNTREGFELLTFLWKTQKDPNSASKSSWCQTWSCCLSLFSAFCSLATSASACCSLFFASANAGSSTVPCVAWASTSDKRRFSDSQFLLSRSNAASFTRKEQKMKSYANKKLTYAVQLPTIAEQ